MSIYLGDFPTSATVRFFFNTFGSNAESITASALAVGDIKVYKNGSTTERSSTSGYALLDTDGLDFDGTTGVHGVSVDTSDNTDAGFFAAGNEYTVVLGPITVNSQTVNFVLGRFSIERSGGALAILKSATFGLSALKTLIDTLTGYVDTEVAAIKAKTDNLPAAPAATGDCLTAAGVRSAVGLASANLDTQLTAIDDYLDTEVAAIKAKTDNLPAAPAATGDCLTAAGVRAALGMASADLDTQLDAILAAAGSSSMALTNGTAQAGTATSITLKAGDSAANNAYNRAVIAITAGTGVGQSNQIDTFDSTSKVATVVETWDITPDATSVYAIYGSLGVRAATLDNIADTVWNQPVASNQLAGTRGERLPVDVKAIDGDTSVPATLKTYLDGSAHMPVDVLYVNGVLVIGSGTTADPWRAGS